MPGSPSLPDIAAMKVTTASLLAVFAQAAVAAESFNYKFNQRDVEVLRFREEPGASKESNFDKKLAKENQHHLLPGIHPELDTEDIRHLHTRQSHQLFYSKNGGIGMFHIPRVLLFLLFVASFN